MNLNPLSWFKSAATDPTRNQSGGIVASIRDQQAMGPWSDILGDWVPRTVSPWLYEALKEAVPMLDGGLGRLVTLDGILAVEGDNDRIVSIIEDWMRNVPVNDLETGYQAAYASQGEEIYEQGHGVIEFVYDDKGREVVGLRVADSKGTAFVRDSDRMRIFYRAPCIDGGRRPDGLDQVERLLTGRVRGQVTSGMLTDVGYVELDPAQLVISVHRPEADNPYGTSLLRSLPFVAQNLLRMQNATGRVWTRFGDPSFHIQFATKSPKIDPGEAQRRANNVAADLAKALAAKERGNSVDLATGVGMNDTITIDVIGAVAETLSIEMPARHMIEQIVAAFGIPAWMIGVSWAQAAGIAEPQSELVLQDAITRFERREPALRRPIEAMLRGRRITWKRGDWRLVQRLPNLHDELKRAQAGFLRAQTAMMGRQGGEATTTAPRGLDNNLRASRGGLRKGAQACRHKAEDDAGGESWAERDPALPVLERDSQQALLGDWHALRDDVVRLLVPERTAQTWAFDISQLPPLVTRIDAGAATLADTLLEWQLAAWERGVENALAGQRHKAAKAAWDDDPQIAAMVEAMRSAARAYLRERGLAYVQDGMDRLLRESVVSALAAGAYDGLNALAVAEQLERRFGAGDYNWERLARSEIAEAQVDGKLDLYAEQGIDEYAIVAAPDACPTCLRLAAEGPYRIGGLAAPRPVTGTHPNCRCSVEAV
ncbi:hypothetical protein EIM50_13790 [Pseudoxanthomonas sp. SGD-10]|nr:hypothetical protein EIM50_13790 [Pseudoxanthomonas sp. SGD-10]